MKDKITQSDFEKAIEGAPHGYEVTIGGKACWNLHLQSLQQILEEAGEELPDEGAIKKLWITGDRIAAAKWMRSEASKVVAKWKEKAECNQITILNQRQQIGELKEELARKDKQLEAFDLQGFYEWAEKEKWYFNTWKDGKWHNSANTHFQTTPTGHLYTIYQAQKTTTSPGK